MAVTPQPLSVAGPDGTLSGQLIVPPAARAVLVLAHGAGAGHDHATLVAISDALAAVDVATLRFNFPFMEAGRRRVDNRPTAIAAIAAAARTAVAHLQDLPLFVGGHSFGGRMASHALAEGALDAAPRGLICMSFPLHPANRPGIERAAHLRDVGVPMLFLSGTRDALADPELLGGVVASLGADARLCWLEDADHGYRTRKRVRRDPRPVFEELAAGVRGFLDTVL